jgi:hypothetical protein
MLTCVPTSRDAPRHGTNSQFGPLNSLPRKSMKIRSMCHCSPAISLQETSLQRENYRGLGPAVDRFVDAVDRCFSGSPLLNRDCESLFKVRRARGKVLSRKNMPPSLEGHSDQRSVHSGSFAELHYLQRRAPKILAGALFVMTCYLYFPSG